MKHANLIGHVIKVSSGEGNDGIISNTRKMKPPEMSAFWDESCPVE